MKLKYNAPVTLTFALGAAIVFIIDLFSSHSFSISVLSMPGRGLFSFSDPASWVRILTYSFAHGSFDHLLSNFSFILLLGPILEEKYGTGVLAALMIITAIVIGLAQGLFFSGMLIGASGLVFMMIVLISFTNIRKGEFPITLILIILLFLAKEIYNSIVPAKNNISEMAHITGGICGLIFGFFIAKPDKTIEAKPQDADSLSRT
jgi:rhomboid protease GluP